MVDVVGADAHIRPLHFVAFRAMLYAVMDMDLPVRKKNRLENYDYSTNGVYFVTLCTKDRKPLLCDIVPCKNDTVGDDAHIVPKPIGLVVEKYIRNVPEIEKYVIMPNHIHLLIYIENGRMRASAPTVSVSNIVRSLKILTTKEIGTPIFQRSYHDHIVRDETDYREIWDYIDQNPQKWALDRYYAE